MSDLSWYGGQVMACSCIAIAGLFTGGKVGWFAVGFGAVALMFGVIRYVGQRRQARSSSEESEHD